MKAAPAPLTHKLILVVLCLNLACLASLVIRGYREDKAGVSKPAVAELASGEAADAESAGNVPKASPARTANVGHRSLPTNLSALLPSGTASNAAVGVGGTERSSPGGAVDRTEPTRTFIREAVVFAAEYPALARSASQPGGVAGRVILSGTPLPEVDIPLGDVCGPLSTSKATTRHYVVSPDGGLANVLVFAYRDVGKALTISEYLGQDLAAGQRQAQPATPEPVWLDQVGCMFEPYVLAMHRNQTLFVRNSDPVFHNVHLTTRINREKNFGQIQGQVNEKRFDEPEAFIRFKCDVHPWMLTYVSVVAHPYFAVTDTNGIYRIPPGLPAGPYRLGAVHLKSAPEGMYRQITIDPAGEVRVDFQLAVPNLARRVSAGVR